jgi:hypothetical protein
MPGRIDSRLGKFDLKVEKILHSNCALSQIMGSFRGISEFSETVISKKEEL